jgi:diguanylate cyclase (GGDEF)-like protein/putative nucleotidyltransferase with HDIG domain
MQGGVYPPPRQGNRGQRLHDDGSIRIRTFVPRLTRMRERHLQMATASIYAEETSGPMMNVAVSKQNETTRSLSGLLKLVEYATASGAIVHPDDALNGVICRPILRMLLSAMRFRDPATVRHCRRVANLAVGLARNLRWDVPDQKVLEVASLLHDVGKIGIPDNILFKPGRLSTDETKQMSLHYRIAVDVLQACQADIRVSEFIADGIGRPMNDEQSFAPVLSEIHQGARILCVADAYDSLNHDQVFREGKDHDDILKILTKDSGSRYDGNVVCALARWLEREGVPSGPPQEADSNERPSSDSPEGQEAESLTDVFAQLYALESMNDGFFLLNQDLQFVVWNAGCERVLMRSAREMLGKTWSPTLLGYAGELGQNLPDGELPLQIALANLRMQMGGVRMRRPNGSWAELEVQAIPLVDDQGKLIGVAELLKDQNGAPPLPADYRELKLAASRDALTGAANRGELENQLNLLLDHWHDSDDSEPFSVIFLDVDFFKNINDTFGHTVGDQVLVDVARLLQRESSSGELVARYGGEEFVLLCPAAKLEQAMRRAERIRSAIAIAKIGGLGNYRVTASFGVTQVERQDSAESVLKRADRALYNAKQTGRNKSCMLTLEQEAEDGGGGGEQVQDKSSDPFLFESSFQACIAADMIVYKLGGFVRDQNVKLKKVTEDRVSIKMGSAGLLRVWGSAPERQPVEITIDFGARTAPNQGRRAAAPHVEVHTKIRPIGIVRKSAVFQARARQVMKMVRSYFAAE